MIWLFLLPIFILGIIAIAFYSVIFQRLNKICLQFPRYELRRSQDLPAHLRPLFSYPMDQLSQAGFEVTAALEIQPLIHRGPAFDWELLLFHPEWNTYAHIGLRHPIEPTAWYQVAFYSFFRDRSLLLTVNGIAHSIVDHLPNTILRDSYTAELLEQWQGHQQALRSLPEPAVKIPRPVYAPALEAHYTDYLEHLWDVEQILPLRVPEQTSADVQLPPQRPMLHRLTPGAAAQTAWNVCRSQGKTFGLMRQYAAQSRQHPSQRIEVPVEMEVESFERMQRLEAGTRETQGGGWLFWGSLVLFVLSFRAYVDGPSLLILVGAIAFHEGGHYGAMRWLGYQKTSVLFLPFLGAAATGQKANASLTEKTVVLLAGPLPGLLLGLLLLGSSEWLAGGWLAGGWLTGVWLKQTAAILIGLNLFNLLPIYPLDGGKIAHSLLFSSSPWADGLFKLAAVAGLVVLGWVSPILWILALAVGWSIPESFRTARLQVALRRRNPRGERTSLRQIFQVLQDKGYGKLAFRDRYLMVQELLERRQESRATWINRCALALLYLMCLLGSPVGAIYAYRHSLETTHPVVAQSVPSPSRQVQSVQAQSGQVQSVQVQSIQEPPVQAPSIPAIH